MWWSRTQFRFCHSIRSTTRTSNDGVPAEYPRRCMFIIHINVTESTEAMACTRLITCATNLPAGRLSGDDGNRGRTMYSNSDIGFCRRRLSCSRLADYDASLWGRHDNDAAGTNFERTIRRNIVLHELTRLQSCEMCGSCWIRSFICRMTIKL